MGHWGACASSLGRDGRWRGRGAVILTRRLGCADGGIHKAYTALVPVTEVFDCRTLVA